MEDVLTQGRGRARRDAARLERARRRGPIGQDAISGMTPASRVACHVEIAATGGLSLLGAFRRVVGSAEVQTPERAAHERVTHAWAAVRGFLHEVDSDTARAALAVAAHDERFAPVLERMCREAPAGARWRGMGAALRLRELAIANGVYETVSGLCRDTPCEVSELWELARIVGGHSASRMETAREGKETSTPSRTAITRSSSMRSR